MHWASYLTGFLACALLIAAIGAQNAFVLRQGLRRRHVGPVIALCIASDALLIGLGVAGFGRLVAAHPELVRVARWAGAVFLTGYGLAAIWRAGRGQALAPGDAGDDSLRRVLATTAAFTFLNPHVYVDTVVLLGAVGGAQPAGGAWPFWLGAVTASAVWFGALGLGARALGGRLTSARAWTRLDATLGALSVALAGGLVLGG